MNAILYFIASGIVKESARLAAKAIADASGEQVVFRNADAALHSGANPEQCKGVAGLVPEGYAAFPHFADSGDLIGEPASEQAPVSQELNPIGLPAGEGCPDNREDLKTALEAEGIDFHPNAKTETLAGLYFDHFYSQS